MAPRARDQIYNFWTVEIGCPLGLAVRVPLIGDLR